MGLQQQVAAFFAYDKRFISLCMNVCIYKYVCVSYICLRYVIHKFSMLHTFDIRFAYVLHMFGICLIYVLHLFDMFGMFDMCLTYV